MDIDFYALRGIIKYFGSSRGIKSLLNQKTPSNFNRLQITFFFYKSWFNWFSNSRYNTNNFSLVFSKKFCPYDSLVLYTQIQSFH